MLLLTDVSAVYGQGEMKLQEDSLGTPFYKGTWITGIAGSISSGSALTDTTSNRIYNNSYGFNLSTGRFFKDRWMAGLIFQANRQNSEQFIIMESEQLFIGPHIQHYISKSHTGSIFFSFSPGFSSFRQKTEMRQNGLSQEQKIKGNGFGVIMGFGYSYLLHRRIAFDLRMNLSNSWINAETESQPSGSRTNQSIQVGELSFSFGFNVLLDSFFF
ncbi:MAG: hypothetical protein P8X57_11595 [Cyclobacteriaceae bacterium]